MPCPEVIFSGVGRDPKPRSFYDLKEFREICRKLVREIYNNLSYYISAGCSLNFIIGVARSPSCSAKNGIFVEELKIYLQQKGLAPIFIEYDKKKKRFFRSPFFNQE
jgi:predicted secreted protein